MMEDSDDDWETDIGEEAEEEDATTCLFSGETFPSVAAALDHDAAHFGFDLREYIKQVTVHVAHVLLHTVSPGWPESAPCTD